MSRKKTPTVSSKIKVLYQNLNGVWYAFAESADDVFFGRVPAPTARIRQKAPKTAARKKKNNDKAA